MKFKVLFLIAIGLITLCVNAQRGVRIGYIDTEYILQNVPEYKDASAQLDKKVLQWKGEIEKRLSVIEQKKKELENESVLLTKDLYEERFEEISFDEAEVLDYQQKRFGPQGDLITQKRQLIEPIQDQIFAAVQQIATTKKFDFVFDKSADVVMLYSAERYDISDQVLRTITRSSNRKQVKNKKEREALENESVVPIVDGDQDERQQKLEERKAQKEAEYEARRAEREAQQEERKKQQEALREAKKREAEERRQKALEAREARRNGATPSNTSVRNSDNDDDTQKEVTKETSNSDEKDTTENDINNDKPSDNSISKDTVSDKPKTTAEILEERRQQKLKDREERQQKLEEHKKRIIEQRKKAREAREALIRKRDSIAKAKRQNNN